ncbi:19396_t:CDS:2, partial [Gigaspora margarita]
PELNLNRLFLKKIVIAGGAGLAFSMLLFLRNAGLPLPGGAIGLSPWVDILPKILGGHKIWPSSPAADEYIANVKALSNKISKKKQKPTIIGHPSFTKMFSFSKPCKVTVERCCDFIKWATSVEDNNTSMIDLLKEDVVSPSILISPSLVAMS